jgi:hypothetical protein
MRTDARRIDSASRAGVLVLTIALLATGAASIALRAVAQETREAEQPQPPAQTDDDADSAQTIEDDPTVAPDEDASADNNVTFPIDI